jgi:hypothetical protein
MRSIGKGKQESSLSVKQEFKLAYKDYSRESVVSPRRKTVQKTRKLAVVAARLGAWEKATLSCIQEMKVEYQFRIADVVKCLERHGLPNRNNYLNRRVFDAVRRLVNRGIVVKGEDRGIYALRRDLARLSVERFLVFPSVDSLVSRLGSKLKGFIKQKPLEGTENLGGGAGVLGGGLDGVLYNGGVGGWGVLRSHVINPPGGWVGYYVAMSLLYRGILPFVYNYIRGVLVSIYGVSFVRELDSLVGRSVSAVVSSARVDRGCHGPYNGSPGGFSPLSPDCEVHNYEYGVDLYVPGYFAQVVGQFINYVKFYVKTPDEIREGNPGYYEDLLRVLGPPPPPPPGFNDLIARLWSLLGIPQ